MITVGTKNASYRDDWIIKKLKKIKRGYRLLDAGAGEQKNKKYCTHLNYVSQDFGQYNGEGNKKGLQTVKWNNNDLDIVCDIVNIPEENSSFDAVLCSEVLEHLPNPYLALKEFHRLLKKDGLLILTAPFCSLTHFAPYHYSTGFSRYYYEKHLTDLGFKIIEMKANGNYFEYLAQELTRLSSVAKKYSEDSCNFIERKAFNILLNTLQRFSEKDRCSSDLLCFGYQVVAKKVR